MSPQKGQQNDGLHNARNGYCNPHHAYIPEHNDGGNQAGRQNKAQQLFGNEFFPSIQQIAQHAGYRVKCQGWVHHSCQLYCKLYPYLSTVDERANGGCKQICQQRANQTRHKIQRNYLAGVPIRSQLTLPQPCFCINRNKSGGDTCAEQQRHDAEYAVGRNKSVAFYTTAKIGGHDHLAYKAQQLTGRDDQRDHHRGF